MPRRPSSAKTRPSCWRSTRCRARTRSTCSSASRTRWRSCRSVSRRASPTPCITTRRASCRRRCTTWSSRWPRRCCSSSRSCSSSCKAGARRIIPTIAIPVSLIATLVVMQMLGFSLNMLSLLGMVLAIGLVVDDAIVVVENVERQLEAGLQAARSRARGDEGGHRPDHRHHRRADGGVRPGRLHSRRRRAALQPVRADGRDLGRHFGVQLADAQSGAERRLPAPSRRDDSSRRSAGSTAASTGCRTPMPTACAR